MSLPTWPEMDGDNMHTDVKKKLIKGIMNSLMTSKGRTFVWNPRSKFNVRRKIKDVRLTFGNSVELTFFRPLPGRTSRLMTITPVGASFQDFTIIN